LIKIFRSINFFNFFTKNIIKERVKPIFFDFLEQMASINEIKNSCLSFYAKIVKIQKVNQKRIDSHKNRTNLIKDYWDNVKSEMHRSFLTTKKNKQKAAKFQVKLI
jgi:hypothetical protein